MIDYIIVGCGLAGIAFCETASNNNKTFVVISDDSQNSSKIAAGLYNPVILKRFSQVWHAQEQIQLLETFYNNLEQKLDCKVDYKLPIYRKLFSVEEQNNWFIALDKPNIGAFLKPIITKKNNPYLPAPYGFGEVLQTGYVNTALLLQRYQKYLILNNQYVNESFDYKLLQHHENCIQYKQLKARHIIFAEGFGVGGNPFFNYLPVDGTKGEVLLIKAINLKLDTIVNSSIYVIPQGNDLYKVGATYNWADKTNAPTEAGQKELIDNLKNLISCDFELIDHLAGVRPTVKDRRPLVGTHPKFINYHILNGLGTRGVMLAPEMALSLYQSIEHKVALDEHIDIKRYAKILDATLD